MVGWIDGWGRSWMGGGCMREWVDGWMVDGWMEAWMQGRMEGWSIEPPVRRSVPSVRQSVSPLVIRSVSLRKPQADARITRFVITIARTRANCQGLFPRCISNQGILPRTIEAFRLTWNRKPSTAEAVRILRFKEKGAWLRHLSLLMYWP